MIKKNEKRKLHTDHEYMKYISTTPSDFVPIIWDLSFLWVITMGSKKTFMYNFLWFDI